jgi:hypothetical protein
MIALHSDGIVCPCCVRRVKVAPHRMFDKWSDDQRDFIIRSSAAGVHDKVLGALFDASPSAIQRVRSRALKCQPRA